MAEQEQGAIREEHFTFPSALPAETGQEKAPDIHAKQWLPPAGMPVRGVVQITHGMCEHIERYNHFASFLASHGFAVCGQDTIGHGKSVETPSDWGHIPAQGGKEALIENVHALRGIMQERLAGEYGAQGEGVEASEAGPFPYFMFGHSMGSFIVRNYVAHYAQGLAGAIVCGTGHQPGAVAAGGLAMARLIARTKGERYISNTLYNLAEGAYGKAIEEPRTPLDWLSTNPAVVDAYIEDPACGYRFTAGAYVTLMGLLSDLSKKSTTARIPQDLPLFLIAGASDPVGNCGRGVAQVYKEYKQAGLRDVDLRLYLGMRHEILNEPENKKVYDDVLQWLERRS